MSKLYCKHCNQPTDYSDTRPKFCSSCREPFVASLASFTPITLEVEGGARNPAKRQTAPPPRSSAKAIEYTDEEEATGEPIESIRLEIEPLNLRRAKETVDNLIFDKTPKLNLKREGTVKGKKINKKQFLRDFQEETKSCRNNRTTNSAPIE